jgi:hypothetical protein
MMIRNKEVVGFTAGAVALVLSGCSTPTRTLEYFREHPEEAKSVSASCKAAGKMDANCANATEAVRQLLSEQAVREGRILPKLVPQASRMMPRPTSKN